MAAEFSTLEKGLLFVSFTCLFILTKAFSTSHAVFTGNQIAEDDEILAILLDKVCFLKYSFLQNPVNCGA